MIRYVILDVTKRNHLDLNICEISMLRGTSTTSGGGYLRLVYDAGVSEPVTASFFLAERNWDYDLQAFDGITV